jgi:leucyl-tRNA synthetase
MGERVDRSHDGRDFGGASKQALGSGASRDFDVYAGADHAVAHLLYARFWQKVLFDAGLVEHVEPFKRLEFLGYVLASDGSKISKRSGNSRNPDDVIAEVGADAFRLYEMAMGPFEKAVPWSDDGLTGQSRFLNRVHAACELVIARDVMKSDPALAYLLHNTIAKVGRDIESFKFNTAVAGLTIFLKESEGIHISIQDFRMFVQLIAPFAPHIAEELWQRLGGSGSVHRSAWPDADREALRRPFASVPVQINGKRRAEVTLPTGADEAAAKQAVFGDANVRRWIDGREIRRFVFIVDRIINIVIEEEPS